MNQITSPDNKVYKNILKLDSKKYRDLLQEYVIEGPNLVKEALENHEKLIGVLFKDSLKLRDGNTEMAAIFEGSKQQKIQMYTIEDRLFEKLAQTETTQGVLGVVKREKMQEATFFKGRENTRGNIIVLDRLQDPGNIGTILRTADGAGFSGAIVIKGTVDIYSPKVVRAATGSLFRLPILQVDTAEECINLLQKNERVSVCATLEGAIPYFECDMRENTAIIIGNEGNGVSAEFIKYCDKKVKIPMIGTIESLNAAVAAGILMYESVRR